MNHQEFVAGYRAGTLSVNVDRASAMRVCDKSGLLPKRMKMAHDFWKWVAFLLVIGGILSLIWVRWWIGLGITFVGIIMGPAVQKSATQFVLEQSMESEAFYNQMVAAGVLKVRSTSGS